MTDKYIVKSGRYGQCLTKGERERKDLWKCILEKNKNKASDVTFPKHF